MFKYLTIASECDTYHLSANYDSDDRFYMPALAFNFEGECTDLWDNDNYLMEELYPYLCGEKANKEFRELFPSKEVEDELKEMFDLAIKEGMFWEYIEKQVDKLTEDE